MNTMEMVIKADMNGKTYHCGDIRYNNINGFHDSDGHIWPAYSWADRVSENGPVASGLYRFIHCEGWEVVKSVKMTLTEVSKALGYSVEIVDA